MEENLTRLRAESQANQRTLLAIQAQLREAESGRYANPLTYMLALLCILLALGLAWLLRQRTRDRSEAQWWATPEGEAVRAAATQIMASGHAPLGDRVSGPSPLQSDPLPPRTFAPVGEMTMPAVTAPAALGTSSLSIRGPAAAAPEPPRREMSVEELIDLEQQVDFFVVLGQDDSAIDLLLSHLRGSGAGNPLPYLKLLDIYLGRGERDAYERIRERFNQQFNAIAPPFGANPADGKSLEEYGPLLARLQFLWADPSQALEVLETSLFPRGKARTNETPARFDLPAYRDLLFLYALARDLAAREVTGNVDVLLPIGDDFADSASPMLSTMAVVPNPLAQKPLEVDFDVSEPGELDALGPDSGQGSEFGPLFDEPAGKPRRPPKS